MLSNTTVSPRMRARSFLVHIDKARVVFRLSWNNSLVSVSILYQALGILSRIYPKIMAFLNQDGQEIADYLENRTDSAFFREATVCQGQTGSQ